MREIDGLDGLDTQIQSLEGSLGGAGAMAAAFGGELERVRASFAETGRQVTSMSLGISRGLQTAFEGVVFDGARLSDALKGLGKSIADTAYAAAIRPVGNHFGSLIANGIEGLMQGSKAFAQGGAFASGRVTAFAKGGVVTTPVAFPMRGGNGLMGEAGPEAIMPLVRGRDGSLGVRAQETARPISVVMNVSTPDVQGFRRSESQISAQMARAISRGQRNR